MTSWKRMLSLLLASVLLLSCAACGGAKAASMWLVKTEGSVAVTDGEGADVALTGRLGLFSGYDVATQAASYGWIDLDETKLTKLDENSDVEVQKDGKNLVLTVNSGSLFFNVTKPLATDETLEIRSSDMVTAIRGTCGWVEVPDAGHISVYILEGTVECSVGGVAASVTAGQRATLSAAEGAVTVQEFSADDIPAFVSAELREDELLAAAIRDATGMDVTVNWTLENGVLTIFGPIWEVPWDGRQEEIRSVVIEDGVTEIGVEVFRGCHNLVSVTIPDSVTSIERAAFCDCTGLTELTIPSSVTYIGEDAFVRCTGLTEFVIPDSVTSIGPGAFSDCTGLTRMIVPDSVTSLGFSAFNGCTGLTEVVIPDSVTSIEHRTFLDCTALTRLVLPGSVTSIGEAAFTSCSSLTEFVIPDGVTTLELNTFSYCSGLTRVSIPNSVTTIGVGAFSECEGLTEVTIPGSVTSIGDGAFINCKSLTEVAIPDSVTSIGSGAFAGCENLRWVSIPDSVTSIGENAFLGTKLTAQDIPARFDPVVVGVERPAG